MDLSDLGSLRSWISQILDLSNFGSLRSWISHILDLSDIGSLRYLRYFKNTVREFLYYLQHLSHLVCLFFFSLFFPPFVSGVSSFDYIQLCRRLLQTQTGDASCHCSLNTNKYFCIWSIFCTLNVDVIPFILLFTLLSLLVLIQLPPPLDYICLFLPFAEVHMSMID